VRNCANIRGCVPTIQTAVFRASLIVLLAVSAKSQWDDSLLKPFVMNHRAGAYSLADVSFLLDAPAGKGGFIKVQGGHFMKPEGKRIRFWGVHLTDWSKGSVLLPSKEDAPMWASTLARFGVNCVRLHFLDLPAPRGIVDSSRNDSRGFDPQQLDRLDFLISELKKRGIYADLNLNVGRSYKAGDDVPDFDKINWGKGLTLYDVRLIELQKEYAKQLLTHLNPYTGTEYRNEPAIAIVEILNENGLYTGFRAPTPYYDEELTKLYNAWLTRKFSAEDLKKFRQLASVPDGAPVPRLKSSETASAPKERFDTETAFFMETETLFYEHMSTYLKNDLGVKCPITGTADHSHTSSPYAMVTSLSKLDILDGHVYWQHPGSPPPVNTPMVNDPLHSTIVQLSRTAFAGKPYTVSETNHPFPNEWASEGIPLIAAYGSFQDWDAIMLYTFEPKLAPDWQPSVGDPFDISLDPVRMTEMATGALTFLRGDVRTALRTVGRTYSKGEVLESRRLPARTEQPYFTPGFPLALPLQHGVRIRSLDGPPTASYTASEVNPIVSDTKELAWYTPEQKNGLVTIETSRTEAAIGFVRANPIGLKNLSMNLTNNFASVVLSSMDGKALARSSKMLLTTGSRVSNTGMKWNETRTRASGGEAPTLIEPVAGTVTLRGLIGALDVAAVALDGAGRPLAEPTKAKKTSEGWMFPVGLPVTTWYVVSVKR
jgi:hypothetical protein